MTNLVRFPGGRRIPAATIPREEFERLAALSLDVVDQIVALLNDLDGEADREDGAVVTSPLGSSEERPLQSVWLVGTKGELDRRPEPCR